MSFTLSKKTHELSRPRPRSTTHSTLKQQIQQVQKITHVYQLEYKNGVAFGLGDFIRGSFCLLQICNKIGVQFDIDVSNHPISNYIKGHVKNPEINYNEIYKNEIEISPTNVFFKKFIQSLTHVNTKIYYTCTNSFPQFKIKQEEIDFIKDRLEPNQEMKTSIDQEMNTLNLVSKQFSVIHIRCGDDFLLKNGVLNNYWIKNIFSLLMPILQDTTINYLILSDNNQLKLLFKEYLNCIVQIKPITHLGEQIQLKNVNVKNTLLDFYLMSHSNQIFAISSYEHGTGFSKWCSVLNNIPYKIIQLTNANANANAMKILNRPFLLN